MLNKELIEEISELLIDPDNQQSRNTSIQLIELLQSTITVLDHVDSLDKRQRVAALIFPALAAESRPLPKCSACGGTGSEDKLPHLLNDLRSLPPPTHQHANTIRPGPAGPGRRWTCPLCPKSKGNTITARSNDMRTHLQDVHGYLPAHIKYVFELTNDDALFKLFGPWTEKEAQQNGLKVKAYKQNAKTAAKRVKTSIEPALPDLKKLFPPTHTRTKVAETSRPTTRKAGTQTELDHEGTTLVDTARVPLKADLQDYPINADACKAYETPSYTDFAPHPTDNGYMELSLAGVGNAGEQLTYPSYFNDSFQNGDYLPSADSSGQNSIHLPHKLPFNSTLQQPPMNFLWQDPHRARFESLNDKSKVA